MNLAVKKKPQTVAGKREKLIQLKQPRKPEYPEENREKWSSNMIIRKKNKSVEAAAAIEVVDYNVMQSTSLSHNLTYKHLSQTES